MTEPARIARTSTCYAIDEQAEAERLAALGAIIVRRFDSDGDYWIVMQDPEGNEFCVCRAPSLDDAWR
jgi:predicted enzyme related to lactoylglutathione lyase